MKAEELMINNFVLRRKKIEKVVGVFHDVKPSDTQMEEVHYRNSQPLFRLPPPPILEPVVMLEGIDAGAPYYVKCPIEMIEPIPTTADILYKLGYKSHIRHGEKEERIFIKGEAKERSAIKQQTHPFDGTFLNIFEVCTSITPIDVSQVHKLQNYFTVTFGANPITRIYQL